MDLGAETDFTEFPTYLELDKEPYYLVRSDKGSEERRRFNPDGYLFITRKVLPRLKELGASDADIQTMMVDNPRRFFGGD